MNKTYIVRHYSHTYKAVKIKEEGKYGYYRLTAIHSRYKPYTMGFNMRGRLRFSRRSTNSYVGDIVKKEKALVQYLGGMKMYKYKTAGEMNENEI